MLSGSLHTYLFIGGLLLAIGIVGMVRQRSLIGILISSEFILNGAGVNLMAFNRFLAPDPAVGQVFTLFIMGIAAAEAAIVISIIIAVYRSYRTTDPDEITDLKF